MPVISIQPGTNTTPDQGSTLAVDGAANNGHASTNAASNVTGLAPNGNSTASQNKSCRWSSFPFASPSTVIALRLKFTWSAQGSEVATPASDGSAAADVLFVIQYSLNGGSSWTTVVSQGSASFNTGASEDISIPLPQVISQIQVRDRLDSSASATGGTVDNSTASASVTATVSDIRLEATVIEAQCIVMM